MSPDPISQAYLSSFVAAGNQNYYYGKYGSIARVWMVPLGGTWDGDLTNIIGIAAAFDRGDINPDAMLSLMYGSPGEHDGKLLELAYVATLERSFRIRHQTPVRALCHCAGRQQAHGSTSGIFYEINNYLQNVLGQN